MLEYVEADGTRITLTTQTVIDDGDPMTEENLGYYEFTDLATGSYTLTFIVPEGFMATDSPLLGTVDGDPEGRQVDGTTISEIDLTSNYPEAGSIGSNYIFLAVDLDP